MGIFFKITILGFLVACFDDCLAGTFLVSAKTNLVVIERQTHAQDGLTSMPTDFDQLALRYLPIESSLIGFICGLDILTATREFDKGYADGSIGKQYSAKMNAFLPVVGLWYRPPIDGIWADFVVGYGASQSQFKSTSGQVLNVEATTSKAEVTVHFAILDQINISTGINAFNAEERLIIIDETDFTNTKMRFGDSGLTLGIDFEF